MEQFSAEDLEAIRSMSSLGASRATAALSRMAGCKIEIFVSAIDVIALERFHEIEDGADSAVVGVYVLLQGDFSGIMLLLFPLNNALNLADAMMQREIGSAREMSDMELSAVQEAGNIMASSFANVLSDFLKIRVAPTPPAIAVDMAGALLQHVVTELGQKTENAIVFRTYFTLAANKIKGHLILTPDKDSFQRLSALIKNAR